MDSLNIKVTTYRFNIEKPSYVDHITNLIYIYIYIYIYKSLVILTTLRSTVFCSFSKKIVHIFDTKFLFDTISMQYQSYIHYPHQQMY